MLITTIAKAKVILIIEINIVTAIVTAAVLPIVIDIAITIVRVIVNLVAAGAVIALLIAACQNSVKVVKSCVVSQT